MHYRNHIKKSKGRERFFNAPFAVLLINRVLVVGAYYFLVFPFLPLFSLSLSTPTAASAAIVVTGSEIVQLLPPWRELFVGVGLVKHRCPTTIEGVGQSLKK